MARHKTPKGERVTVRGYNAYVTEHRHAYLVRGFDIDIDKARLALFEFLDRKKWTRICAMPSRPLWTGVMGEEMPVDAVAFYFNIGPRCDSKSCGYCSTHDRDMYKP